jgi:hypothetical protein
VRSYLVASRGRTGGCRYNLHVTPEFEWALEALVKEMM